jgi:hypothetical protein
MREMAYRSYIKEIKAYDGIHETVNVVGSSGWPLETEAVEHLRGIAVGSFYPGKLYNGMCHLVDG